MDKRAQNAAIECACNSTMHTHIGCCITQGRHILARGYNHWAYRKPPSSEEMSKDTHPTLHAEMHAIEQVLKRFRLMSTVHRAIAKSRQILRKSMRD